MTPKSINCLAVGAASLLIVVAVASTVDEFDRLAGKTGAALDSANNNEIYRGVLADFRYYFCEELQKELVAQYPDHPELKRQTKSTGKKKKGASGEEEESETYAESELQYFKRVLAVLASLREVPELSPTEFQPLADRVMAMTENDANGNPIMEDVLDENGQPTGEQVAKKLIRFDPSRTERAERGPKQLPKMYIKAAESLWNGGNADKFIQKYTLTINIADEDRTDEAKVKTAKIDAIARKIQALEEAERQKIDLANKYAVGDDEAAG